MLLPSLLFSAACALTSEWLSWVELDGFGAPRHSYRDLTDQTNSGEVTTTYPQPGVVVAVDGDGYVHEAHHDSHGRLVEVIEGRTVLDAINECGMAQATGLQTERTGSYAYDGRGRVVTFTDGNDDAYWYGFDGAGRLRQVWRKAATYTGPAGLGVLNCQVHLPQTLAGAGATKACGVGAVGAQGVAGLDPWYAYTWDGQYPSAVYEGKVADGQIVTETFYDELGRPQVKTVWNEDEGIDGAGDWDIYAWRYDVQWIGAPDTVVDPAGGVQFTYDEEQWGFRGKVTSESRYWSNVGHVADFAYTYDFQGRTVETEWPDTTLVQAGYAPGGWPTSHTVTTAAGKDAYAFYTYDDLGLLSRMTAGELAPTAGAQLASFDVRYTRTPGLLKSVEWREKTLGTLQPMTLLYDNAGRLIHKLLDTGDPGVEVRYDFDELQRVSCMMGYGPQPDVLETYVYDVAGNPLEVERPSTQRADAWGYASGSFGQLPSRTDLVANQTELYEYDDVGRMSRWDTFNGTTNPPPGLNGDVARAFTYDGMGRLVRQTQEDAGVPQLDTKWVYDADNVATYEERTIDRFATITRFRGERIDHAPGGETVLQLLPFLRSQDGELRWIMADQDGSPLVIWDSSANEMQFEVAGVYGDRFDRGSAWYQRDQNLLAEPWDFDGLHGSEPDRELGLAQHGVRHAALNDGRWLQPEPLLRLGFASAQPRMVSPVYAAGNPLVYADVGGQVPLKYAPDALGAAASSFGSTLVGIASAPVNAVTTSASNVQSGYSAGGLWGAAEAYGKGTLSNWVTPIDLVGGVVHGVADTGQALGNAVGHSILSDINNAIGNDEAALSHAVAAGDAGGQALAVLAVAAATDGAVRGALGKGAPASKGAKAGPELVATENGAVVVKGENYNLVGKGTDDFTQIHSVPDHNGVGASSGIDFHTHKPELTTSPTGELSKVGKSTTPTTAADLDDAAEAVRAGYLVPK